MCTWVKTGNPNISIKEYQVAYKLKERIRLNATIHLLTIIMDHVVLPLSRLPNQTCATSAPGK
ncbi:hypothetical protein HanRHA438_Chr08g0336311 [Helianthus annuus]|nr:hypothetical protein HanRHA438_Chr08g0336311 [Helianthus annuus]